LKLQEKSNRKQSENANEKMKELNNLNAFLDLKLFPDFNRNPKILLFRERSQKKKELEQVLLERKNLLAKVKESYLITKNIHEAEKQAKNELKTRKNSENEHFDNLENLMSFEIKKILDNHKRNFDTSSKKIVIFIKK